MELVPNVAYVLANKEKTYYTILTDKTTGIKESTLLPKATEITEKSAYGNTYVVYKTDIDHILTDVPVDGTNRVQVDIVGNYLYTDKSAKGGKRKTRRRKQSKRKISRRR